MSLGLYFHIPFCLQKCGYCNFVITLDRTDRMRTRFLEGLRAEICHIAEKYGRLKFGTFYLGGGTPSLLSGAELRAAISYARRKFDFEPDIEMTVECNPGDLDAEKIRTFRELGINRVSLGVQAFQDSLLKRTGRLHSVEDTYRTVNLLHSGGIENISFDLISGLPGQSAEDFQFSLNETVRLGAKQLSFYDLEIHDNTPWGLERKAGVLWPASELTRETFFTLAIETMTRAGFCQYEVSTFAKPGFESRHNLIYWHNQEYLGLGPGAYSYIQGVRSQFSPDVPRYLQKCEALDWKPDLELHLSEEEKEKENLITWLRLREGIRLEDFPLIRPSLEESIPLLIEDGVLSRESEAIVLTPKGRYLVESTFRFLLK